ncbi:hypothetical protein C6569_10795 [Phreatobacter cathodiphilus]|uniref:Methyltransferase FkbM domain-containing protein n=1 Tax=Phreatobacter cathodiphilus TaxID=1868589 RepID=A0A2S0NBI0_9HYPH|nr:hypothetical protein C6569_10795 [Phreatobacter cathodiphilus]
MFEITRSQCRYGAMHYNGDDSTIGASLTRYGEWAEHEIEFLSRFVKTGATVLDVGANIGCHSVAFSRMVGDSGKVFSFEPFSDNHLMLRLNTRDRPNVTAVQALVGASQAVIAMDLKTLTAPGANYGAISYKRVPSISGSEINDADLAVSAQLTLDMFASLPVDLVKIDVEGMEFDVLVGARSLIAQRRPIVYFEQNGPAMYAPTASLLAEFGYKLFWHVCYPFNRNNYRGDTTNIFGDATELNVLAVPLARFDEDPTLFERIRYDVHEAQPHQFERPEGIGAATGREVADWAKSWIP